MKKLFAALLTIVVLSCGLHAQAPTGFTYQAVARNVAGRLISNHTIGVRFNIVRATDGISVFMQTGTASTNANGLFSVNVGEGSTEFANINWSEGPYFLNTDISLDNDGTYPLSTSQKILSVPYALYATVADRLRDGYIYDENDPVFHAWNYDYRVLNNAPTRLSDFINDLRFLTIDSLSLTIAGDTLFLNNKYIILPDRHTYTDSIISAVNYRVDSLQRVLDSTVTHLNSRIDSAMNRIYELEHPYIMGSLDGVFSVSSTKQVIFSKGLLQYRPRIKTWRFASSQYDYSGNNNNSISSQSYCTEWLDLFGYGTSGWDGGAVRFMPYETSTSDNEYSGSINGNDLTGDYANGDWGYYNPIMNGGNQSGLWRTLSNDEWTYLLSQRSNARQLRGAATVMTTPGYLILPDDWECPSSLNFIANDTAFTGNTYNSSEWQLMEANGAVFLPCSGTRAGSTTSNVGTVGNYWTSTCVTNTLGYVFHLGVTGTIGIQNNANLSRGCSVRLVHDY